MADASSWNHVAKRLQHEGYMVIAPANPLRGMTSDSAYMASVLAAIPGPIVLVAHSYGGAVITNAATGNPNVKALVYVAAFIPDMGETAVDLLKFPGSLIVLPPNPDPTVTPVHSQVALTCMSTLIRSERSLLPIFPPRRPH